MLARDILGKVNRDFGTPDEAALALSVLADFAEQNQELSSDRVMFQTGQEKKGVSLVRQSIVVGFVLG
jgi:hypothetical protein